MEISKIKQPMWINLKGELYDMSSPVVMGIMNVTPDSFFADSRSNSEKEIVERTHQIISQGASIIDLGAYSSRPDSIDISEEEEMNRLAFALKIINREVPDAIVSIDTFRSKVAKMCVEEKGAAIINDISGGENDSDMFKTVAELKVPYILMHMRGTPQTMMNDLHYDNIIEEMIYYFSKKIHELRQLGVNDIIVDPGFGFSKTVEDNYKIMKHLSDFLIFEYPVLAGISRKSMIYKFLQTDPSQALNGTTVLNTLSLASGASILRVHDVTEAVETLKIFRKTYL